MSSDFHPESGIESGEHVYLLRNSMVLQFPVRLFFLGGGDFSAGGGIYPSASGRNLDFCLCTIPTVGLHGKLGGMAATHKSNIKHTTELPPPPSSAASIVTNRRCRRQWIPHQLAMPPRPPTQWGEGLSILLAAGVVVQRRCLRLRGTPGWREMALG